jgi:pimeloyl-ACP methyl ester carboxylesterase
MPTAGRFRYLEAVPSTAARPRGTFVLLHAFPLNARMWEPQLAPLADAGWRVIAPQMRGVDGGDADPPTSGIDDYAADVVDLLDALHVEDAVIGGCSMGGYLTLALVRLAPNYIRGLVLVDTRPQADAPDAREGRLKLLTLAQEQGAPAVLDEMLPKLVGDTTRRERTAVVERVRSIATRNSNESVAGMVRALMSRQDSTALLPGIRVPALIVVGEEDSITPPALSRQMHEAIAGSQLAVLPRVGHLPNLEDPAAFNDVLVKFLSSRV